MQIQTNQQRCLEYLRKDMLSQIERIQLGAKFLLDCLEDPDCFLNFNTIVALQEANKDLTASIGFLIEDNSDDYDMEENSNDRELQ